MQQILRQSLAQLGQLRKTLLAQPSGLVPEIVNSDAAGAPAFIE